MSKRITRANTYPNRPTYLSQIIDFYFRVKYLVAASSPVQYVNVQVFFRVKVFLSITFSIKYNLKWAVNFNFYNTYTQIFMYNKCRHTYLHKNVNTPIHLIIL